MSKTQVVILCGGKGTRLREKTEEIPKPMVEIGEMPILWHIMKIYAHYGFKDFVLCLGYKGEVIRNFFVNLTNSPSPHPSPGLSPKALASRPLKGEGDRRQSSRQSFAASKGPGEGDKGSICMTRVNFKDWRIVFAETGPETNTGGRIKRAASYIQTNPFLATYGDGLSNINIASLLKYHKSHGKIATMTCVKPRIQFGVVSVDKNNAITGYEEKPPSKQWVNGGFFVFNKDIFRHTDENDTLEIEVLNRLIAKNQLVGYPFDGFWECMDTYKDTQKLNDFWNSKKAPWNVWG